MGEIRFDTGVKSYSLNGCCEVAFNPTDSGFAEKLSQVFSELDGMQERMSRELAEAGDGGELFELSRRYDRQMREKLDGLFDRPICEALFGDMNVYALAGGLPVWANLLLALLDEAGESLRREQTLTDPALEKYLAKYRA